MPTPSDCTPRMKAASGEARKAMEAVEAKGVKVRWGWSRGHSGLEWNEKADKLANRGREGAEQSAPEAGRSHRT